MRQSLHTMDGLISCRSRNGTHKLKRFLERGWIQKPVGIYGSRMCGRTKNETTFTINDVSYSVAAEVPVETNLNTFIRDYAHLSGTKFMCEEGGCGSCIVYVRRKHPTTGAEATGVVNSVSSPLTLRGVGDHPTSLGRGNVGSRNHTDSLYAMLDPLTNHANYFFPREENLREPARCSRGGLWEHWASDDCLVLVFSCHQWEITTVEGLGDRKKGYHPIQTTLANYNGTQCGYCTPGMVMNMYSLSRQGKGPTMAEMENSFGGNICRCTGYRSILDAFKTLCVDAPPKINNSCHDIETARLCRTRNQACTRTCGFSKADHNSEGGCRIPVHILLDDAQWYRVSSVDEIFQVFAQIGEEPYQLVAGNTAHGAYRRRVEPRVYIDVSGVPELRTLTTTPKVTLGGNVTLREAMEFFNVLSAQDQEYAYTRQISEHIDLIANVPVRNIGTIAGNLMLKHEHREFDSDMFLLLETVGASLIIKADKGSDVTKSPAEFLDYDMNQKVLYQIVVPPYDNTYVFKTYKIHASQSENYLKGKSVFSQETLTGVMNLLEQELQPDYILPDASPQYRKGLAEALYYKFLLQLSGSRVKSKYLSGGELLTRPPSSGVQQFQTDSSQWPLNQPVPKIEALVQCSGEAEYVNDHPPIPGQLFAAFVLTTEAVGNIVDIDPSPALVSAADILAYSIGRTPLSRVGGEANLYLLFCSGKVLYEGQPVGIIVAVTRRLANKAANNVRIQYTNVEKPVIQLRDIVGAENGTRVDLGQASGANIDKGVTVPIGVTHVVKGSFCNSRQYHFTMETQTCLTVPTENGLNVFSSTQWMDNVQGAIAQILAIPENSVVVSVRRVGGAYGSKISRANFTAAASALAANILNKPVRMILRMETNMRAVGVDDVGNIKYLKSDFFCNIGSSNNYSYALLVPVLFPNCYTSLDWSVLNHDVMTHMAAQVPTRAPATFQCIASIEYIMQHIANVVQKDPVQVRINNIAAVHPVMSMIDELKTSSQYDERLKDIEAFNKVNRWKKKGISLVPMQHNLLLIGTFRALVSIYAADGTVTVQHAGTEIGQGINTKVAQVCAHTLGIPLDLVSIQPSNSVVAANGDSTAGSVTSDTCCYATIECCKILLARLEPVRLTLVDPTWQTLVSTAKAMEVDLTAVYMFSSQRDGKPYAVYGVCVSEVEIDVLTGQQQCSAVDLKGEPVARYRMVPLFQVKRVDILEDAGQSISPLIDVGQVTGAFVMGMGVWTHEDIVYDPTTGAVLTNRTWNYYPPGMKDIPIDFRVTLKKDSPNPVGVARSKGTGEPALCLAVSVFIALRNAINSARTDAGVANGCLLVWCPDKSLPRQLRAETIAYSDNCAQSVEQVGDPGEQEARSHLVCESSFNSCFSNRISRREDKNVTRAQLFCQQQQDLSSLLLT
uniref:FAD-binding PCMH-type domain-containing protein n=1 Tax=Timema tahoe TaxID=61484 RepID=A0A7R9IMC4_9NEOP|nr:unnamed protein product [Timema tahoe]